MRDMAPRLIIVAGANGSGKTTFAVPYTEQIGVQFLNADQFAKAYADRGESNAMIKGGREFFRRLNAALERKEDDIIRRYYRSIKNFRANFTRLVDVWFLYYNGGNSFQLVASGTKSETTVTAAELHEIFENIA